MEIEIAIIIMDDIPKYSGIMYNQAVLKVMKGYYKCRIRSQTCSGRGILNLIHNSGHYDGFVRIR